MPRFKPGDVVKTKFNTDLILSYVTSDKQREFYRVLDMLEFHCLQWVYEIDSEKYKIIPICELFKDEEVP